MVTDNNGGNFLATNTFDVQAINDKPVRVDGNVSTLFLIEDAPIASMGLEDLDYSVGGGTDETASQTLSYQVSAIPDAVSRGSVYLSADVTTDGDGEPVLANGAVAVAAGQALTLDELRNLKFLAAENGSGTSTFVFTVTDTGSNDGDNINFITETVNLDILAFNDTPVLPTDINGDLEAIVIPNATEDTVYQFTASQLLQGVVDPDIEYEADGVTFVDNPYGDVLVVENLSVTNGTLTGPDGDGNYSYTPDQDFEGVANFNYLIKDGQGGSISNSVNLTVTAVNDAPIAEYDIDQDTAEGSSRLLVFSLPQMWRLIVEK